MYAVFPSGVIATPPGFVPAVMVLVAVSILETELDPVLATYAVFPSGVNATPLGYVPTVMVLVTVSVAVSITDTEPDRLLVTYAVFPSGVNATPPGAVPTVMVLVTLSPRREGRVPGMFILFWPSAVVVVCAFVGAIPIVVSTAVAIVMITILAPRVFAGVFMSTRSWFCAHPICKDSWWHRVVSLSFSLLSTHTAQCVLCHTAS